MAEKTSIPQQLSNLALELMEDDTTVVMCRTKAYKINDENAPPPAQKQIKSYIRGRCMELFRTDSVSDDD